MVCGFYRADTQAKVNSKGARYGTLEHAIAPIVQLFIIIIIVTPKCDIIRNDKILHISHHTPGEKPSLVDGAM